MAVPRNDRLKIYLAGPEVFLPDPQIVARKKRAICERHGFEGVFPIDSGVGQDRPSGLEAAMAIYQANVDLIRDCDLLIANMTPFRGPSMDVGTAFEMGLALALEKPVFGYSEDRREYRERVSGATNAEVGWRDENGLLVEDFGLGDNLMLVGAIRKAGREVAESFEACVRQARAWYGR